MLRKKQHISRSRLMSYCIMKVSLFASCYVLPPLILRLGLEKHLVSNRIKQSTTCLSELFESLLRLQCFLLSGVCVCVCGYVCVYVCRCVCVCTRKHVCVCVCVCVSE